MKEQTRVGIAGFIVLVCTLVIWDLMVLEISLGSLSDILIRRCLFVFAFAFVAGGLDVFYGRKHLAFGPFKYAWSSGLLLAAIVELGGVWKIKSFSRTTQTASEVYSEWLSQWWIIVIALSLGALGGYVGSKTMLKWKGRSQKKPVAS